MAIQLTRKEYEEKYGAKPPMPSLVVPEKMTRKQYEDRYGESPILATPTKRPLGTFVLGDVLVGQSSRLSKELGIDEATDKGIPGTARALFRSSFDSGGAAGLGQQLAKIGLFGKTRGDIDEVEKANLATAESLQYVDALLDRAKEIKNTNPEKAAEIMALVSDTIRGASDTGRKLKKLLTEAESNVPTIGRVLETAGNTALTAVGLPAKGIGLAEKFIAKTAPSLAKTVVPSGASTFATRAISRLTTTPGLARMSAQAAEFGLIGAGFRATQNLRSGEPVLAGTGQAFLFSAALPVAGNIFAASLRPAEKAVYGSGRYLRSFAKPTSREIEREIGVLRRAYDDVFSARESTNTKVQFMKEQGKDPAQLLANHGIIPKLEYANGKTVMRTRGEGGTVEQVSERIAQRGEAIQKTADKVQSVVGRNIPISRLKNESVASAKKTTSGLELDSTIRQINSVFRSVETKYGKKVGVGDVNFLRKEANRLSGAWDRPQYEQDAYAVVGNIFRKHLDDNLGTDLVRRINKEIGELIAARKMLFTLDGKGIGGGRFTNIVVSSAAAIIGAGGYSGGLVGRLITGLVSSLGVKAFMRLIQSQKFGGGATRRILEHLVENRDLVNELVANQPEVVKNAFVRFLLQKAKALGVVVKSRKGFIDLDAELGPTKAPDLSSSISKAKAAGQSLIEEARSMKLVPAESAFRKLEQTGSAIIGERPGMRLVIKDEGDFFSLGLDTGRLTSTDIKLPSRNFATKEEAFVALKPLYERELALSQKVPDLTTSIKSAKQSGQSFDEWVKGQGEIMYHGTNEVFDKFDFSKSRFKGEQGENLWGFGVYTSPNIGTARNYGKNILEIPFTPKKPLDLSRFKTTK